MHTNEYRNLWILFSSKKFIFTEAGNVQTESFKLKYDEKLKLSMILIGNQTAESWTTINNKKKKHICALLTIEINLKLNSTTLLTFLVQKNTAVCSNKALLWKPI